MTDRIPITAEGKTKALEELTRLKNVERPKIVREIATARAHGDLSENAEYEAARARQDFVRARIAQLEERMRQLSLYNLSSIPKDMVAYGSRVTLEDMDAGEVCEYRIVFPEEVDPSTGHISLHSPIGQALLRKSVGDEVEVVTPQGKRTYQLIALATLHDITEELAS